MRFEAVGLTIELEVIQDALVGQLVPPQRAEVELQLAGGERIAVPVDEVAAFLVRPLPQGSFRLHCRTDDATVLTDWISL